MSAFPKALPIVALALAAVLAPPSRFAPSEWAARHMIVADGERAGELWDPKLTPYLIEPLDKLGPHDPTNEIAVMKSAQTGFTTVLIAAIGHSIDLDPCRMMLIQPTDAALSSFNREKLMPTIEATKPLAAKVERQTSRSGEGSTTYSKKYRGGSLTMALGSSAADLRSRTIKKMFRDEIDEYPDDLDGQGDPLKLSDARQTNFLAGGEWKRIDISTPTVKGGSKIERRYEGGDRRRWHVRCPHCDDEFVFEYGQNFRHDPAFPFKAHYAAPCCGAIIWPHERDGLVRKGRWIATASRPGAYPSYHFDALSSPFVPWDAIAREAVESADDPSLQKAFYNTVLGLPFEVKGDAPDHELLLARREDYGPRGHIPPRGLWLTAAADVQLRGIWYEVVAWAPNRESWVVDADYLDGATDAPDAEAFEKLKRVLDRDWPDAFGGARALDALGVDSGYRAHVVYAWVRANNRLHPNSGQNVVLALKGRDGWNLPAMGQATPVDIDLAGRKLRKGANVSGVGTFSLKGTFYSDVAKPGIAAGKSEDPPHCCHFARWQDENYFRQITSEYLTNDKTRGKVQRLWKLRAGQRDNHYLDCRVYNMALFEYLGISRWTEDEKRAFAKERGLPSDALPLFAPRPSTEAAGASTETAPASSQTAVASTKSPETIDEKIARLMRKNNSQFS